MASSQTRRCLDKPSIVEWFGDHEGYKCGYCKSSDTNYSHGMWAHVLNAQDYESLINRGWRRSGKYCYKPCMRQTCCPQYPIMCDVENFTLNKSHKKIIKTMNRFLIHGERSTRSESTWNCLVSPSSSTDVTCDTYSQDSRAQLSTVGTSVKRVPRPGDGADPNKPPCMKAKEKRILKKMQSQADGVGSTSSLIHLFRKKIPQPKTLEELLDEPELSPSLKHTLEVRLVRTNPLSRDYSIMEDECFKVYKAYQAVVHQDLPEEITERSYKQFLVDSPIQPKVGESRDLPGTGSYHTQYILDGKLIAVGVIDILPTTISSVYLFYDPEYSFLSLGTYTALREISYTRKLRATNAELQYYNMGFYIHSCPKMRYKRQFNPSYLICPETYRWVPVKDCLALLDANPYSRLCKDQNAVDEHLNVPDDSILILHKQEAMTLPLYRSLKPDASDDADIRLYASLIGSKSSQGLLLYRS